MKWYTLWTLQHSQYRTMTLGFLFFSFFTRSWKIFFLLFRRLFLLSVNNAWISIFVDLFCLKLGTQRLCKEKQLSQNLKSNLVIFILNLFLLKNTVFLTSKAFRNFLKVWYVLQKAEWIFRKCPCFNIFFSGFGLKAHFQLFFSGNIRDYHQFLNRWITFSNGGIFWQESKKNSIILLAHRAGQEGKSLRKSWVKTNSAKFDSPRLPNTSFFWQLWIYTPKSLWNSDLGKGWLNNV